MGILRAKIGGFDFYFLLKSMGWENIFGPTPKYKIQIESLVAPSIVKQFQKENFEIEGMSQRMMRRKAGKTLEIDALLTNNHIVIPVEVKTTLNVNAVDEHIQKHLIPYKHFFPEYHNKIVYGAVAYIHVEENADRYAYKKGLYVLTFGDNDMVVIKNDKNFKPVEF